jgi:NAD(P)-dependent dehydrogenase (short-subunit alcohol dehydrogenase family)
MENRPVALITGCSTGIGYETALLLSREGWRVFATMRNLGKSGPLREAARGLPLDVLPLDVDESASVSKAVRTVLKKAGRVDALVNNAGWGAFGALDEFTDAEIRAQYETNVFGLMRLTRAVLPTLRAQGRGRILHIGSLAGKMSFAGIGLYCSTKFAVEALTEGLRTELRPFNIECSVVEPGSIKTPFKENRRKAGAFLQGRSAHQRVLQNILDFGNKQSFLAPGPKRVARTILKALRARRMAARYPVGLDAVWFPFFRWFLPNFLYDRVLRAAYARFGAESAAPPKVSGGKPVALVTGATSGFGLETARLLAQEGYRVYATYRNPRKLAALEALAHPWDLHPIPMEAKKTSSVDRAVGRILRREGRIDVLVNNAGFAMAGFLEDLSDKDLKDQFETNVFGALRVVRAAAPSMRERRSGKIVNLGSISGRVVFPGIGAYAAGKFALRALTEGLRQELRPFGIEVSEIAPGSYATQVAASARFGKNAKSPSSPYRAFRGQVEALARKDFEKGRPPQEVARLILRALKHSPMRPVYMAGWDARLMAFLKHRLPDSWFEWLFTRVFPWSRRPSRRP